MAKAGLATFKFRHGRKLGSAAITADAWNDAMDILSALTALAAVGLTLSDPVRFLDADRIGGIAVGVIVVFAGVRVARDTAMQLIDTMPDPQHMDEIRAAAATVTGVRGVEKCFARKTGCVSRGSASRNNPRDDGAPVPRNRSQRTVKN